MCAGVCVCMHMCIYVCVCVWKRGVNFYPFVSDIGLDNFIYCLFIYRYVWVCVQACVCVCDCVCVYVCVCVVWAQMSVCLTVAYGHTILIALDNDAYQCLQTWNTCFMFACVPHIETHSFLNKTWWIKNLHLYLQVWEKGYCRAFVPRTSHLWQPDGTRECCSGKCKS